MSFDATIPLGALVVVADRNKALFFKNNGPVLSPDLELMEELDPGSNPSTHERGSDRPGRAAMGSHRSALDQTDWHDIAGSEFMSQTAKRVQDICTRKGIGSLVIVAPPRALSELRQFLPDSIRSQVVAELDKDLTKLPVSEINRHLSP